MTGRVPHFLKQHLPLSYTWCFPLTHAEGRNWHPSQLPEGSAHFNYCQLYLSGTFLTQELCTEIGVNKLFPLLWHQPHPRQKCPCAQFPALVDQGAWQEGTFKRSSSAVFTCKHWIFLTIPALRGKLHLSWQLGVGTARIVPVSSLGLPTYFSQSLVLPSPALPPREGLCHCCYS